MDIRIPLLYLLLSATAMAGDVRLYSRPHALAPAVLDHFTAQTGHTVTQYHYDDLGVRDQVVRSGRGQGFDLLMVDSLSTRVLAAGGHLADLPGVLPSIGPLCGAKGLALNDTRLGLAYRASVMEPPTSWQMLFAPGPLLKGRVVMGREPITAVAAALLADGLDPYSERDVDLRRALARFELQAPYLLTMDNGLSVAAAQGQRTPMALTLAFAGDERHLYQLTRQSDWRFVVPDEGSVRWGECLVIPAGNELTSATRDLLTYLAQPEVMQRNAALTGYDPVQPAIQGSNPSAASALSAEGLVVRARLIAHLIRTQEQG